LCFDYTTGILITNPLEDFWANVGIGVAYFILRFFQLWLGSLYWQKERELLSVKKNSRNYEAIKTQTWIQFGRTILSTVGFYLLVQQSLYIFIALIVLDTLFVPCRMKYLMKKDDTHAVQNVLVDLWHLYDSAQHKLPIHNRTLEELGKIIKEMRTESQNGITTNGNKMNSLYRRPYLSF
tara:strand:- start:687 stop:1226 length:540 start_codon:yes stop_codon:yes gene_type:complete